MTYLYEYPQVLELMRRGGRVEQGGTYVVWVWAREGCQVRFRLGNQALATTHAGAVSSRYSWAEAGRIALRKGERFELGMDTAPPPASWPEVAQPAVGFVALSSDPGFNPEHSAEVARVLLHEPGPVADARIKVRDTDTPWTLRRYATREEWERRADLIRRHLLVCLGLWPLPEKSPLKPRVFGRLERDGYSVEKVFFESLPGFFVCGNLYRPLGKGPYPGILSPHGHWGRGRLEHSEPCSVPGRCINLARQGHAVFAYDMVGYVDSDQLPHRFGGRREDLWGIGAMGLQLWNSIRSLDLLCSFTEVDASRLACTGASGGGTQTFALAAVDDRVKAAAPVNMVSAHMQGGCSCENQGHLRLQLNNVEIAACMAPRPLLLVSATGDWTANTPDLEFPAIQAIYRLYGAEDRVTSVQVDAGHNYNQESRQAVYGFFGRWLLGDRDPGPKAEQLFTVEPEGDLRVFAGQPRPAHALDESGLVDLLIRRAEKRLAALAPADAAGLRRFRKAMGPALQQVLGVEYPGADELYLQDRGRSRRPGFVVQRLVLGRRDQGERVPALLFAPVPARRPGPVTLVVHPEGKAALADGRRGRPGPVVSYLLERGHRVLAIDPFLVGEFHPPFGRVTRDQAVGHFATYNQSDAACRVQDVLTVLGFLAGCDEVGPIHLLALEGAGPLALLAGALAPRVRRIALDWGRLAADQDLAWMGELFIPGIRSAGDVRTALALVAPGALLVHRAGPRFPTAWARRMYRISGGEEQLQLVSRRMESAAVLEWLTER